MRSDIDDHGRDFFSCILCGGGTEEEERRVHELKMTSSIANRESIRRGNDEISMLERRENMCSLTLRKFLLRAKIFPSVEKTIEGKILNLTSLRHHHKKGSTSHTAQCCRLKC